MSDDLKVRPPPVIPSVDETMAGNNKVILHKVMVPTLSGPSAFAVPATDVFVSLALARIIPLIENIRLPFEKARTAGMRLAYERASRDKLEPNSWDPDQQKPGGHDAEVADFSVTMAKSTALEEAATLMNSIDTAESQITAVLGSLRASALEHLVLDATDVDAVKGRVLPEIGSIGMDLSEFTKLVKTPPRRDLPQGAKEIIAKVAGGDSSVWRADPSTPVSEPEIARTARIHNANQESGTGCADDCRHCKWNRDNETSRAAVAFAHIART